MQTIPMAVLPKCDIDGCNVDATFDAPTHTSGNYKKYLCRTHYLKLADKELPANLLKLTHVVKAELENQS